jgi:hypothetical protein
MTMKKFSAAHQALAFRNRGLFSVRRAWQAPPNCLSSRELSTSVQSSMSVRCGCKKHVGAAGVTAAIDGGLRAASLLGNEHIAQQTQ